MEANSKNPIDMLIIVAVVLLVGVAGTWFFVSDDEVEQALVPPKAVPEPVAAQVAQIEEAQEGFTTGLLKTPVVKPISPQGHRRPAAMPLVSRGVKHLHLHE